MELEEKDQTEGAKPYSIFEDMQLAMRIRIQQIIPFALGVWVGIMGLALRSHERLPRTYVGPSALEDSQTQARIAQLESRLNLAEGKLAVSTKTQESRMTVGVGPPNSHWVCKQLSTGGVLPTTDYIWNQNLAAIHKKSQLHRNDPNYAFGDFTAQLLALVSPRLPLSLGFTGADPMILNNVMDRIQARYEYLQNKKKPYVEPVKILVLGGSVLVGRNCRKLVKDLGHKFPMPNRECNWAHRLNMTLHEFLPDVFNVTKIAMGGTNTAVGTTIFRYDLIPDEAHNPDVVVNAYSTNDMHVLTMLEANSGNQTLRDRVMEMIQEFVRVLLKPDKCKAPPLLLHVDDYIGNEQRGIMATTQLAQSVSILASYYKFPSASYANLVREWVYFDTHEFWFSPEGWYEPSSADMQREIHPGMGAHISIVWVVLYNLLNTLVTHCGSWTGSDDFAYHETEIFKTVDRSLEKQFHDIPGKPVQAIGLPPILNTNTSLETISENWASDNAKWKADSSQCLNQGAKRCVFSWVAGLSLQQNSKPFAEQYFKKCTVKNTGWKMDEGEKLGFVPTSKNESATLQWSKVERPIKSATMFYLKSYGEKWENSSLHVTATRSTTENQNHDNTWSTVGQMTLYGTHDKQTSEMYTGEMLLDPPIEKGQSLELHYTLVAGTTFKIMGLAVCS